MVNKIQLHNTLTRKKELFVPLHAPFVGLYVCGPTVYGDPHLGHARSAITFDLLFRLLGSEGYRVRYVRNITDVGHLVGDADAGEDKVARMARLEQLEPMEVAQLYTNRYEAAMTRMGCLRPSIEPHASGHIIEQMELTQRILDNEFAYLSNGSVYFDVRKYAAKHNYGTLSGRNLEDLQSGGRSEDYVDQKRFQADFALWKKAEPEHIMQWNSPWGKGFPGWHCECSAMSAKYLGERFDIHGGGMDLIFPHHECEIAQSTAALGHPSATYWVHNNMITVGGQKMGKSLGNSITLDELVKTYSPMTLRFFILQAHYRSTLDFSSEALEASQKGLQKLMSAWGALSKASPVNAHSALLEECLEALRDDLNSPIAIARLFDAVRLINSWQDGKTQITSQELGAMRHAFDVILGDILGLAPESDSQSDKLSGVMSVLLEIRSAAKDNKDWATSDLIRDQLQSLGIILKDRKDGTDWQ